MIFVTPEHVREARAALKDRGCLLIERACDAEFCEATVDWMNSYASEEDTERRYGDTELRIWHAQKRNPGARVFWEQSNAFISALLGKDTQAYTVLAIRNRPIDLQAKNLQLGRWHADSFRHQYKTFLFLGDVRESTGPFEFVPRTHKTSFKLHMAAKYFQLKDLFSKNRSYSRFDDAWVERLGEDGYSPVPVLCPAGTVMIVDTSAIHRARPCFGETRYALTTYFR